MKEANTQTAGPWYREGLQFECRRCGRCCGGEPGYVWVTAADLKRIAAFLGADPAHLTATSTVRVGRRRSLRERANGDCVFHAAGCLVYPVRPTQCRTFPFWPEHIRSRGAWERLARACPGIGSGRRFTTAEINLLAGRPAPVSDPGARLGRAIKGLLVLYRRLDAELAPMAAKCQACGRCCDFTTHDHVLYVTELERQALEWRHGPGDRTAPAGHCPYQAGTVCTAREGRPLGCRTFFCEVSAGAAGRAAYERALGRLARLREASGLAISYAPLLDAVPG